MEIKDALQNVYLVISEFRGTVNGQVLTNREHIGLIDSFKTIATEITRLQEVETNVKKDIDKVE